MFPIDLDQAAAIRGLLGMRNAPARRAVKSIKTKEFNTEPHNMASSAVPSDSESTMTTHTGFETTFFESESKQLLVSPFAVSQQSQENANIQESTIQAVSIKAENTGRWTAEEHRLFLAASSQYGNKWRKIAAHLQTRTASQVRTHALKYYAKVNEAKKNGGDVGDVDVAFSHGPLVSGALNKHRTHAANIETGHWTEAEHDLFLDAVARYGRKWKKIAEYVETRTAVQVRTHAQKHYARLAKEKTDDASRGSKIKDPNCNTGKWTAKEHDIFLNATLEHGKNWKKISEAVKTRTAKQVGTHARKFKGSFYLTG
eukprot:CAMPEP_0172577178 /NCGR_PEP_ID=MMETSP1067-20121228/138100_1 /TAXON_ID=265564 ORGANISM="Thalassiosira punctigera, Strain Tpunct2005C2" /NCGR_SAMPLE_ID=MMETSP1067 /ASSEMBLY_ACC=CAM_ASM_000444 /LENGTH=313 /DNA_ID=CAMNT_0013369863 /DNA_START=125 /DNA_END=1066 /DNA_ORIENTATION=+